jgi:hypothetical protein
MGKGVQLNVSILCVTFCATKDIGNRLTNNIGNTSPMGIARMGGGKGRQGRAMRRQQTQRDGAKGN